MHQDRCISPSITKGLSDRSVSSRTETLQTVSRSIFPLAGASRIAFSISICEVMPTFLETCVCFYQKLLHHSRLRTIELLLNLKSQDVARVAPSHDPVHFEALADTWLQLSDGRLHHYSASDNITPINYKKHLHEQTN
jgi:hypothetical protein